jgi:hypothetical protein
MSCIDFSAFPFRPDTSLIAQKEILFALGFCRIISDDLITDNKA